MELTISQIENITDGLKNAGYDVSELDNDQIAMIVQIIIDAIDPENI